MESAGLELGRTLLLRTHRLARRAFNQLSYQDWTTYHQPSTNWATKTELRTTMYTATTATCRYVYRYVSLRTATYRYVYRYVPLRTVTYRHTTQRTATYCHVKLLSATYRYKSRLTLQCTAHVHTTMYRNAQWRTAPCTEDGDIIYRAKYIWEVSLGWEIGDETVSSPISQPSYFG